MPCRILAENVLHKSLKVKLKNLTPGPNTRQLCRAGINKIKDMIRKVGWVPQKGILYVIPTPEHTDKCVNSFLDYDFSKVVTKVSGISHIFFRNCTYNVDSMVSLSVIFWVVLLL